MKILKYLQKAPSDLFLTVHHSPNSLSHPQVQSFIRPYPQSTNGRFLKQHFNHKTGEYSFSFITNQLSNQYSEKQNLIAEIYIPLSVHYPNGYSINLNPNNLTTEMKGNTLSIYLPTDLRNEHVLVEMKMVRK